MFNTNPSILRSGNAFDILTISKGHTFNPSGKLQANLISIGVNLGVGVSLGMRTKMSACVGTSTTTIVVNEQASTKYSMVIPVVFLQIIYSLSP